MINVPLLLNHDPGRTPPIGRVFVDGGNLCFEFFPSVEITRDMLFDIFGGAGYGGAGIIVTEQFERGGRTFIRKGCILEFSLGPQNPAPDRAGPGASKPAARST